MSEAKKLRLNDQQSQALEPSGGKNILISASAGTGKTTVLIERVLHCLIVDRFTLDELLVMSFTEAAALELRLRLKQRLEAILAAMDRPEPQRTEELTALLPWLLDQSVLDGAFLRQQLDLLPGAHISTIHSFCLDVVHRYGYLTGQDPRDLSQVMDDSDAAQLTSQAMDEVIRENITAINELIMRLCPRPEDLSPLETTVRRLARGLSEAVDPAAWRDHILQIYRQLEQGVLPAALEAALVDYQLLQIQRLREAVDQMADAYRRLRPDLGEQFDKLTPDIRAFLDAMAAALKPVFDEKTFRGMLTPAPWPYPRMTKVDKNSPPCKQINNLKSRIHATFKAMDAMNTKNLIQRSRDTASDVEQLLDLAQQYNDRCDQLKRAAQCIDFDDMERYALQLLKNGAAEPLSRQFKQIMIDEFQDSSQKQEEIAELLTRGGDAFRVGDVKQSIYGFRHARPQLMLDRMNGGQDKVLTLFNNYRSTAPLIAFTNDVFDHLMNREGRCDFTAADHLTANKPAVPDAPLPQIVRLRPADGGTYPRRQLNVMLARVTAKRIAALWSRLQEENQHAGSRHSLNDIVVLLRSNKNKLLFCQALEAEGIPAFTNVKTGFYDDAAVSTAISVLTLICDPQDDYAALDVLRGPLYRVSDDTISRWFIAARKTSADKVSVLELARANGHPLAGWIDGLAAQAPAISLSDLLTRIYCQNDWYLTAVSADQRTNLDFLYDLVCSYQQLRCGLPELIRLLKKQRVVDRAEASPLSSQDQVVRVMTIHQSKGLEFAYEFFPDLSEDTTALRDTGPALDDDLGFAMDAVSLPQRLSYVNPYRTLIRFRQQTAGLQEELRLLYVALTRAGEQLTILTAPANDHIPSTLTTAALLDHSATYAGWIQAAEAGREGELYRLSEQLVDPAEFAALTPPQAQIDPLPLPRVPGENETLADTETADTPSGREEPRALRLDYRSASGADRGTKMHQALQRLGIDHEVSAEEVQALGLDLSGDDIARIVRFYRQPDTRRLFAAQCASELPFVLKQPDRWVHGTIDLLARKDDEVVLIDFKTDRAVTPQILKERYQGQLAAYRQAVSQAYPGAVIHTRLYSFDLEAYVDLD